MLRSFFLTISLLASCVVSEKALGQADTDILNTLGGPEYVIVAIFAATGVLILVLLAKRQILRMLLISQRGAHTTIASGAPRKLAHEIEASIRRVERLRVEPRTLAENMQNASVEGLISQTRPDSMNNLHNLRYRFKAMDSMTFLDDLLHSVRYGRKSHQTVRDHLVYLQQPPHAPLAGSEAICESVIKLYEHARYGKKEFGEEEYRQLEKHIEDLKSRLREKVTIPGILVSPDVAGSSRGATARSVGQGSVKPTTVIYSSTGKSSEVEV